MARFALIGFLSAIVAVPAVAQPEEGAIKSVSMFVSPTDLQSPDARARFDRQVANAINVLCGDFPAEQIPACRRTAREQINAQLASHVGGAVAMNSR